MDFWLHRGKKSPKNIKLCLQSEKFSNLTSKIASIVALNYNFFFCFSDCNETTLQLQNKLLLNAE